MAYLAGYAAHAFWRAIRREVLAPSTLEVPRARAVAAKTLAFTFLNPHVYLDTVLLLGTVGNQYGVSRWSFAAGACLASILWFCGLGYGARSIAPLMARPATWRLLDSAIGIVMVLVAVNIARTPIRA